MLRVEAGARQAGQTMAQAVLRGRVAGVFGRLWMQGGQRRLQAGKAAQQKGVDAGVFQRLDGQALQRAPVVGEQRQAPAAMAGQVASMAR